MSAVPFEVRRHKDKNYLAKNVHCELIFFAKVRKFFNLRAFGVLFSH